MTAAQSLRERSVGPVEIEVTLVKRNAIHDIRMWNFVADLVPLCMPLDEVLVPVGVPRH